MRSLHLPWHEFLGVAPRSQTSLEGPRAADVLRLAILLKVQYRLDMALHDVSLQPRA